MRCRGPVVLGGGVILSLLLVFDEGVVDVMTSVISNSVLEGFT